VAESNEGSIEGWGKKEMLPERGDPFTDHADKTPNSEFDQSADVFPRGEEREKELDQRSLEKDDSHPREKLPRRKGPREDGGMHAVGPLLPEDLEDDGVPPPVVEPELPPPPTEEVASILEERALLDSSEVSAATVDDVVDHKKDSLLISELRWKRLYARADLLGERINKEVDNPHLRKLLLDQIAIACDKSLSRREQFEESERILHEVESRINLEQQVRKWSASIKTWMLTYELFFALLFALGLIFLPNLVSNLVPRWFPESSAGTIPEMITLFISMMWGGLGGIVNALIGLWVHHTLDQEIDRPWATWFFANPFMGLVLGALIFLLIRALLLGLFPSFSARFDLAWIPYILSGFAGFKQNVFYDLIERVLKKLDMRRGRS
jgi:hypothetical protein